MDIPHFEKVVGLCESEECLHSSSGTHSLSGSKYCNSFNIQLHFWIQHKNRDGMITIRHDGCLFWYWAGPEKARFRAFLA